MSLILIIIALVAAYFVYQWRRRYGQTQAWIAAIATALLAILFLPMAYDQLSSAWAKDREKVDTAVTTQQVDYVTY